jgi:hypothetical protein
MCDAVPFCFGPVSKLLTIAEILRGSYDITFLVAGTSLELAKKAGFNIIECDTEIVSQLNKHRSSIEEADFYLNVMNPISAKFVKGKVPQAYVDSLFWMWDIIPNWLFDLEYYFIQNFVGVASQLDRMGSKIKNKIIVGPIIDSRFVNASSRKYQLLVNFGGMESKLIKVGKNTNYPFFMNKLIKEALEGLDFDRVLVTGSENIIRVLDGRDKSEKVKYAALSHEDFLKELSASKMLLTSPGLTASFEAFWYKIPTLFLPPQNYSQFLNLKKFRTVEVAKKSVHWTDFYPEMDIKENEDEQIGVKKTLECINRFEHDAKAMKQVSEKIRNMVSQLDEKQIEKQYDFVLGLGGNGAETIANVVSSYLG